jgi:hypothetical protein
MVHKYHDFPSQSSCRYQEVDPFFGQLAYELFSTTSGCLWQSDGIIVDQIQRSLQGLMFPLLIIETGTDLIMELNKINLSQYLPSGR